MPAILPDISIDTIPTETAQAVDDQRMFFQHLRAAAQAFTCSQAIENAILAVDRRLTLQERLDRIDALTALAAIVIEDAVIG